MSILVPSANPASQLRVPQLKTAEVLKRSPDLSRSYQLETKTECPLYLTRIECIVDASKRRATPVAAGQPEIGVIERVEQFEAEISVGSFSDCEPLRNTDVEVPEVGPPGTIPCGVARSVDRLQLESIDVEKVETIGLGINAGVRIPDSIGAQITPAAVREETVWLPGNRIISGCRHRDVDRQARLGSNDGVELPASDDGIQRWTHAGTPFLATSVGNLPHIRHRQALTGQLSMKTSLPSTVPGRDAVLDTNDLNAIPGGKASRL